MPNGIKLVPLRGINTDLAAQYRKTDQAYFIKNLYYFLGDFGEAGTPKGTNLGTLKPLQSNEIYCPVKLPEGDNFVIGTFPSKELSELYVWVYNSLSNHSIFRINGNSFTSDVVVSPCFDFELKPEYFVGEGQCWLEVLNLIDPDTNSNLIKRDLYWTTGNKPQGFLRFDDALLTNSFDPNLNSFFAGTYNKCVPFRMGVPTPKDCIKISELDRTAADDGLNNTIIFNTWQFRIRHTDVWGRPSEWGIISDEYISGINDCINSSANIPRCLDLQFDAGNPFINTIEIAWRNCNDEQWFLETTLFLYDGTNLNKWWQRPRNKDIVYDPSTNRITYKFCRDKECDPIDVNETNRLQNPLPKTSQAIFKLNREIALANNEDGFAPFPKDLLDKITFEVTPPKQTDIQTRSITIYCPIFQEPQGIFTQVSKDGTNGYYFGGFRSDLYPGTYVAVPAFADQYLQRFANKQQSGFIGYLVGGGFAISTQVYLDANNNLIDDPTFDGFNLSPRHYSYQKFVFTNVPKGTYIFRLASHLTDPSLGDYQKTSTTVWGRCNWNNQTFIVDTSNRDQSQELIIDVCNGDYDTLKDNKILLIADMAAIVGARPYKSASGYVYETRKNGYNQNPVELMNITLTDGFGNTSNITDHNGFYYYESRQLNTNFHFNFINKCNGASWQIGTHGVSGTGMRSDNYWIDERQGFIDYFTTVCNRILIQGRLVLSGTNIGISNSEVVLSRGQTAITDDNGNFTIIAHDDVINGIRKDVIVIGNGCGYTAVNGGCIEVINVTIQPCQSCTLRTLTLTSLIQLVYQTERSLLSGGTYGKFAYGHDWLGRVTYAQPLGYMTIPSIIQSQAIGASVITATIDPNATFPDDIEYITFGITAETTIEKYLTWIVDRFELIDSSGAINNSSPSQIKIYYESINEFNKLNNFNTTTGWQFIPEGKNTPVINDKVQFLINGDGKFFSKSIIGLVKYDLAGKYFLIDYTSDLKDLKQNALIRLIRPKTCIGNEPNFEVCKVVEIVNRKATENTFVLNFFDTYYLSRQIPVPVSISTDKTQSITTTTSTGGITTAVTSIPTETPTVNELRTFGFRFEHNSPSNFWGDGCWNAGRVNSKNPFEARLRHLDQVALSGQLSENGQLNYLSYFDKEKKVTFNVTNSGGIVYARVKTGVVLFVGQFLNYMVGFGDNTAIINKDGNVIVPSGPDTFGQPQKDTTNDYGCTLFDKNTIRERKGLVHWLDRNCVAVARHNFSSCVDVSRNNRADSTIVSWLTKKIKYNQNFNQTTDNIRYFHGVINPCGWEYILTDFEIKNKSYFNEERDYAIEKNESFAFDIFAEVWKAMYSPTPEYYGFLEGSNIGQLLFYFNNALPYSNSGKTFNTFFGRKAERVYRFTATVESDKKLSFKNIEVYCKESLYWADQILTETGQLSRILKAHFNQAAYFWQAPFLCDINTPPDPNVKDQTGINVILDGNTLYGIWIDIRLIGDQDKDDIYSELSSVDVFITGNEKSGTQ